MTARNKIPSEIILDEDLHSKRIADLIKVNAERFNESLAKIEDVRKVIISESEIYELIIGTVTTGTIAKNYYKEFPPEMMLISQNGLDSALQELKPYIIFFQGNLGVNVNRYHFEFIEVQDSLLF